MLIYSRFLLCAFMLLVSNTVVAAEYVGSEKCSGCHPELYSQWAASGHHLQLRRAEEAQQASLPLPKGYTWEDISYVIGGIKQQGLFVDQRGFIITAAKDGSKTETRYHPQEETWSNYFPGQKKTYDCAGCHTTNYNPNGHQDGLEGIVGTWTEDGIGCEACHGPGGEHINKPEKLLRPGKMVLKTCGNCHQHGGIDYRPLIDIGLTQHHRQLNELKSGVHKALTCTNCHNPHRRALRAKYNCTICHTGKYDNYKDTTHGKSGIKCYECHMPKVAFPAISTASYIGGVRKHLFRINTAPDADMFSQLVEKNYKSTFVKGYVTVEYACLNCHVNKDKAWAVKHSTEFHK